MFVDFRQRFTNGAAEELAPGEELLVGGIDELEDVLAAAQDADDRRRLHEHRIQRRPRDQSFVIAAPALWAVAVMPFMSSIRPLR